MDRIRGEYWLPIKGYEDCYEVSTFGRIRSVERIIFHPKPANNLMKINGRILRPSPNGCGYLAVNLCKEGVRKTIEVHTLVINHFGTIKPSDLYECNHKDGNKLNNSYDNLEWLTNKENNEHTKRIGLLKRRRGNGY